MTHLGYARVSTEQQSLDMQLSALRPLCGERIWQEKKSGMSQASRCELAAMIEEAKRLAAAGEQVVIAVYSLSRLGRRVIETVGLLEELRSAGIGFMSVTESIDTTTPMGRAFLAIVAALAQAEAEVLSERTKAGLQAKREAGVKLGRKVKQCDDEVVRAKELIAAGYSLKAASKEVGLSRGTLQRRIKAA